MDEGARAERGLALLRRQEADPRRRACTRSARRPAARTSPSAGAAARRRSRSSATRARARAATATSHSGKPEHPPDPLEPLRLAHDRRADGASSTSSSPRSTATTSPDRGAGHYAATIRALKRKLPGRVDRGADARLPRRRGGGARDGARRAAEVFNHNIETVRRLHRRMRGAKASYDKALWLLAPREGGRRLPGPDEVGDHRRPRRDERRGRRDDARPARARRRRRHDRPVPPAVARSTRRSTAGCTRTSSAGSASRARRSASAPVFSGPARPLVSYRADEQRHAAETGARRAYSERKEGRPGATLLSVTLRLRGSVPLLRELSGVVDVLLGSGALIGRVSAQTMCASL